MADFAAAFQKVQRDLDAPRLATAHKKKKRLAKTVHSVAARRTMRRRHSIWHVQYIREELGGLGRKAHRGSLIDDPESP